MPKSLNNILLITFITAFLFGCCNNHDKINTSTQPVNLEKEISDSLERVIDSLSSIIIDYREDSYFRLPTEDDYSLLFKSKCGNYIWGITKIEGYFSQHEYPNFGNDYVVCDCFTITNGQKVYLNKINELISSGNDLFYKDSLNNFGTPINLSSLTNRESTLVSNSTINNPIILTIFINHPTYTGIPVCYSTFDILRVESKNSL